MQSLSLVLANLQQPTAVQEPKASLSHTLQRGLTKAGGKVTSQELDLAQTAHTQPLTQEVVSSALSRLHSLNSPGKRTLIKQASTPAQMADYRKLLIEMIRPADKSLTMILLGQLMAEKPFFDADQNQIRYRLQQLAADLAQYPYLAIWIGIGEIRTKSEKRGFPETAEILREVADWAKYIADAFVFIATLGGNE